MLSRSRGCEFLRCVFGAFLDALTFFCLNLRSSSALAAENLFLRKQLVLYVERKKKACRAIDSVRFTLAQLSRFFEWRPVLTVVKPDTLICWHRKGFRLFWKWKSHASGRPRIPVDLRKLIVHMALNNPWGEERIANELLLKIGIQISPRTVRRYMPNRPEPPNVPSQRWMTFVRNHAKTIIAADFFVLVTATFRFVYVLACGFGSK
jgi:putative transposase